MEFFVRKPIGLIFVEKKITFFALIGESYAFICESFALFRESYALFRESFAFIRESYALIREKNDFFLYENEPNRLSNFAVLEFLWDEFSKIKDEIFFTYHDLINHWILFTTTRYLPHNYTA